MIKGHGTLTLGNELPLGTTAADGTFVLTMLASDQISDIQTMPWRLVWCGLNAKLFWVIHKEHLQPGAQIDVTTIRIQPLNNSEIHATVTHLKLIEISRENKLQPASVVLEQLSKTEQLQPV